MVFVKMVNKMKKYALVFSGQGSERVGMFRDFLKEPTSLNATLVLLKDQLNLDLLAAVETKDATVVASHNQFLLCLYHHLVANLVMEKIGYLPSFALGHSFGQFSALAVAKAVPFTDMVGLVQKRTEIINSDEIEVKALFQSIHGMTWEAVEDFLHTEQLDTEIAPALQNQKEQVVCAATGRGAKQLEHLAEKYHYLLKEVPVSRPYHTSYMEEYNQRLLPFIEALPIEQPLFPIVLNFSKKGHINPKAIREEMKVQMVKPVYWYDSVLAIEPEVDAFVIIDPSETQIKILRRITNKKIHHVNQMGILKMLEKKGV